MGTTVAPQRWELAPAPADGAVPSEDVGRPPEYGDGYLTAAEAAAELAGLEEDLAARERAQVAIVGRLERLVRSKRIEQLEGLAPDRRL